MRFETLCGDMFKEKGDKNDVFVSNFHFGKYVENTFKNRLEMNAFCFSFESFCGDLIEKNVQKTALL